eukprot:gene4311-6456_t
MEFLKELGPAGRRYLLAVCNASWLRAEVPQRWRQATIVPLLKSGKKADDPASYRPVSLTVVTGKICDRMVQRRLAQYLESSPARLRARQAGFRQNRGTEEQAAALSATVHDGMRQDKKTLVVFLDHRGAFNKAWRAGALHK